MYTKRNKLIFDNLLKLFPNAGCELNYKSIYELLVSVMLSAQSTDVRVNIVTVDLFKKYPDVYSLSEANYQDVISIISSLGLYKAKGNNIINTAKLIVNEYGGIIPNTLDDLIKLPGVGRKTANVVLSEGYHIPAIAVDTHVSRVSVRLGLSLSTDPYKIEIDLQNGFPKENWHLLHHLLIFFGRYLCNARNPKCDECPFTSFCKYYNKT